MSGLDSLLLGHRVGSASLLGYLNVSGGSEEVRVASSSFPRTFALGFRGPRVGRSVHTAPRYKGEGALHCMRGGKGLSLPACVLGRAGIGWDKGESVSRHGVPRQEPAGWRVSSCSLLYKRHRERIRMPTRTCWSVLFSLETNIVLTSI